MNGTRWTAPGFGSEVQDLIDNIEIVTNCEGMGDHGFDRALEHLEDIKKKRGADAKVNLELTGHDLTPYDLARLRCCE